MQYILTPKKGYVVTEMEQQTCFIVRDMTQVAKLLDVDRRTITRWFTGKSNHIHKTWMVQKGYYTSKRVKEKKGAHVIATP